MVSHPEIERWVTSNITHAWYMDPPSFIYSRKKTPLPTPKEVILKMKERSFAEPCLGSRHWQIKGMRPFLCMSCKVSNSPDDGLSFFTHFKNWENFYRVDTHFSDSQISSTFSCNMTPSVSSWDMSSPIARFLILARFKDGDRSIYVSSSCIPGPLQTFPRWNGSRRMIVISSMNSKPWHEAPHLVRDLRGRFGIHVEHGCATTVHTKRLTPKMPTNHPTLWNEFIDNIRLENFRSPRPSTIISLAIHQPGFLVVKLAFNQSHTRALAEVVNILPRNFY